MNNIKHHKKPTRQEIAQELKIPALLSNPYLMMTEFLRPRIGEHQYKSSRVDGNQKRIIDDQLIEEYAELEQRQVKVLRTFPLAIIFGSI